MAEVKKSLATKNMVEVIGKVVENNLKVEKDYVNGSLTVKYGSESDQVVQVSVYVSATKGENKEHNKKYDKMKQLSESLITMAEATEEQPASIVRINGREPFTPQIELNEYASNGDVISNPQVSLGFGNIKITDIKQEDFKATYEMVVYLTATPKMVEGDRLKVDAIYINYKGEVKPLSFFVEDEDLIEGIEGCEKGETIEVWGDIKIANVVETKEKKSGFGGKAKTDTTITTTRELIITGGNPIDSDDKRAINPEDVKKGLVERESFLEELKKDKPKEKKGTGGFGGAGSKASSSGKKNSDIPF